MEEHEEHLEVMLKALKTIGVKRKQFPKNINLINDMRRVIVHRYCNR